MVFLGPNREVSLRLPAGVAQELHRTRTKPLLTSRWSWVQWPHLPNPRLGHGFLLWHFSTCKESWEMEFVHWHGTPGTFGWFIWNQRKDFKMMTCCYKLFDCCPSMGFFEDSACRWPETDWRTPLLCVWPISFLQVFKCVSGQKVLCNSWLWLDT